MMHLFLSWIRISPLLLQRICWRRCPFSSEIDPFSLGKRVLAVNLSDLAAMGAYPLGLLLD